MALPRTFAELQHGGGVMVHLRAHADRAAYSLAKVEAVGFTNIELLDGVRPVDAYVEALAAGWRMRPGLLPGGIGNTLAMLALMRRVVDDNLPYLLVFEDDVLPHPLVEDIGPIFWDATPNDVDWVFLGNQMEIDPDERSCVVAEPCYCTHAFVVTRRGARCCLDTLERRLETPNTSLTIFDIELLQWMRIGTIRYACWNGTHLPKAFPTSDEVGADRSTWPPDIAWALRDTGVFYQNYALGSLIQGTATMPGAERDLQAAREQHG